MSNNIIISVPTNNNITVVTEENTLTIVNPITSVVEVLTGPQGKKGDQGPIGPSGSVDTSSLVTTSSFNSFISSYNTGSFSGSFAGPLVGTASWAISASGALTASYVNLLAGPNITINYQPSGIAISSSGGGGGTPGGSNSQIQYNSASMFAGNFSFTFNYVSQSLNQGISVAAIGIGSHAQGERTVAIGAGSHAEGFNTVASGDYSHAGGLETTAYGDYQTVYGRYNDTTVSDCLFVVGAGNSDSDGISRVNGFSVRHDGSKDAPSITIPVGTTEPSYAVTGTMYFNPNTGLRFYDGTQWFTVALTT